MSSRVPRHYPVPYGPRLTKGSTFYWTIEMQIKAAKLGLRFLEIPVPYRTRVGTSKISGTVSGSVKAGYKILYTIAKYGLLRKTTKQSVLLPKDVGSITEVAELVNSFGHPRKGKS